MSARRNFITSGIIFALMAAMGTAWVLDWIAKKPVSSSGGFYFPGTFEISGPHFFQSDPRWGSEKLAATEETLSEAGCAVSSAAMVLAFYGADTDPGRLNRFLQKTPGGYTPEGWIYWEKAAEVDGELAAKVLPHYENAPSRFLIDWNLFLGNPVIVRIRHPDGPTHFVVICGKSGFDYLIRDPGSRGKNGVYPLKEITPSVEALRFYKKP